MKLSTRLYITKLNINTMMQYMKLYTTQKRVIWIIEMFVITAERILLVMQ